MNITTVKNNFLQKHIILADDWLEQCLEWIQSENPNATDNDIENQVYREWLTLDLREVEVAILSPNLNEVIETTLHETLHLQLMYVIDISKPKYLQLTKMRSGVDDHVEEDDTNASRMLKLVLTDGVQEISAIEYKKIECLHLNMAPGSKVCLKPPISIRRGQIILKPGMIKLCGGSLIELEITNCPENILAAALNQPLNNNPNGISAHDAAVPTQQVNDSQRTSVTLTADNTTNINAIPHRNGIVEDDFADIMDDEFFDNQLRELRELEETPVVEQVTAQRLPVEEDRFTISDEETTVRLPNVSATPQEKNVQPSTSGTAGLNYLEENFDTPSYDIHPPQTIQLTAPKRPILAIEKLNRMRTNITKGIFAIQAEVESVVEKISVSDHGFAMKINVIDKTGEMVVSLHSKVITELLEVDPEVFMAMKESAEKNDDTGRQLFMKKLQKFVDKLNELTAKFVVTIESKKDPVITEILEYIS